MPLPKLIAIDIDGTLLNSDGKVSLRNRAALHLATAHGAEIVIATGRRHTYAMRILAGLGLGPAAPLISSNGAVIRTLGSELLDRRHLRLDTVRWLLTHIDAFRRSLVLTFDTVGPSGDDTRGALACEGLDELHGSIGRWMKVNEPYIRHVDSFDEVLSNSTALPIQAMLCGTVARMHAAEALLAAHPLVTAVGAEPRLGAEITLHRTVYPDRDLAILDILPAGCSKASALQELTTRRGLAARDVLAIGDNWNDLPMLQFAGRAVLMGNAPADLQALAAEQGWTLAASNDQDGVALTLEALFPLFRPLFPRPPPPIPIWSCYPPEDAPIPV